MKEEKKIEITVARWISIAMRYIALLFIIVNFLILISKNIICSISKAN